MPSFSSFLDGLIEAAKVIVPTIISWFTTKDTNDTNTENVEATNETNKQINKDNLDYNSAMTQAQWERDDTAHQREVADLKAAGLSPLASTSGLSTSNALGAPSPIAMQAPQIDSSAFINSVIQASQLMETKRHNMVQEGQEEVELQLKADEINQKAQELKLENKKVDAQISYQSQLIGAQNRSLAEAKEHNYRQDELKRVAYESEQYWKEINDQTGGKCPHEDYYDIDKYKAALNAYNVSFSQFLTDIGATSESSSSSKSGSGTVGGQVQGNGISLGGSGATSSSESTNMSQKQQMMYENWLRTHPMPVYHESKWEMKYKKAS